MPTRIYSTNVSGGGGSTPTNIVIVNPASSSTNLIQPASSSVVPLSIEGAASQSVDLTQWYPSGGTPGSYARVDKSANFSCTQGATQGEAFGASSNVSNYSVAVGYSAEANQNHSVSIGANSTISGAQGVGVGYGVSVGSAGVAVGYSTTATGNGISIGSSTTASNNSIAVGVSATNVNSNEAVFGSTSVAINDVFFGQGHSSSTPTAYSIHGTYAGGASNTSGGDLTLTGGKSTGNASGGNINFQVSTPGSSGASQNGLTTIAQIDGTAGGLTITAPLNSTIPLVINGAASPSHNLTSWVLSGTTYARIDNGGNFSNNEGSTQGEAFGAGANTAFYSVAVGYEADAGQRYSVAIGNNASTAEYGVAVGFEATSTLGSIAIGYEASNVGQNEAVFGSANEPINDVYFGQGNNSSSPSNYTIHGTNGTGSNVGGAGITIAGGKGTGSGAGGAIIFETAAAGSSGSSLNSLVNIGQVDSTGKWTLGVSSGSANHTINGSLAIASPQTTLTGSAGTAICSQPEQGSTYKKVVIYLNGYTDTGTQTYTYPTAFTKTPYVYGAASGVSGASASTSAITFTTTLISGFVFLEGY